MKYYNLYINFKDSSDTYHAITEIFGVKPTEQAPSKFETNQFDSWWHQVVENEADSTFDFINVFLDMIEPNLDKLAVLGIKKSDILFWLVNEYDKQCSMEFHPQEMKRLGESGIGFNIDCFELKEKQKTLD